MSTMSVFKCESTGVLEPVTVGAIAGWGGASGERSPDWGLLRPQVHGPRLPGPLEPQVPHP